MKKTIKTISWWLVIPFFCLVVLIGCKSREKTLQKTETQSEKNSEATYKIEDKTFEIVSGKELVQFDKSTIDKSEETKKDETKNIEVIKEYYENGNLKSEINKSFSQLSEATKNAISEIREELSKEKETSKYWKNSSNHYYQLWQQELTKSKTKDLTVKSKPTFTWQWFLAGLLIGWIALPPFFRWLWAWIKRFQPWIKFMEWFKNLKFKK